MALPSTIACKVSSESAGYVSMSRVERVDVAMEDLAARILGVCGKNPGRVAAVLARGTLVSGDNRYRWQPIEVSSEDLADLLDRFPDFDPEIPFDTGLCTQMVFRGSRGSFEITREVGLQRRLFRRQSFWDEALVLLSTLSPRCERYSYSDQADVFVVRPSSRDLDRLRRLGSLLRFTSLERQVASLMPGKVSIYARRS